MHRQPAVNKWIHFAIVQLMIFAVLFLAAKPAHAESGITSYADVSSDFVETEDAADGTASYTDAASDVIETADASGGSSADIIAEETDYYIKSLDVDITVHEDNVYDVTETYVYDFIEPHHGPVREIPTNHYREYGDGKKSYVIARVSDFQVTSPDANTEVSEEDGAYYIGSSDEDYTGEHTYVMSYTYSILSPDPLDDADELYYNIVGTGWACPIASVSWRITMPSAFDAEKVGYSVGTSGTSGYDPDELTSSVDGLVITGQYHTALYPYEGITIRCELPDGYFVFHSHSTAAWIAIAALLLIPLIALLRNCKRGRRHVVPVVNFYPPKGMNPLDVEEIWSGKTEHKVALIPYLADRGYICIEEPSVGKVQFRLMNNDFSALKPDEKVFLEGMFPGSRKVGAVSTADGLEYTFHETMDMVGEMHSESAGRQIHGKGLQAFLYVLAVVEMTVCPAIYTAWVAYTDDMSSAMWFGIIAVAAVILCGILVYRKKKYSEHPRKSVVHMIVCVLLLAMLFVFVCGLYSVPAALLMLAAGCLNFLAAGCAAYRTEENLKYYGDVLGYRNFIEKAELSQLKMLSQENPSYFYFTLAYACVFDLENQWISQFEKYDIPVPEPTWYYGYRPFTYMAFRDDFHHMMQSSSVAMNATPPSESSGNFGGFSGGGFSGRGSGGGGGGAW